MDLFGQYRIAEFSESQIEIGTLMDAVHGLGLVKHGNEGMGIGLFFCGLVEDGLIASGHAVEFKFFELFECMSCVHGPLFVE